MAVFYKSCIASSSRLVVQTAIVPAAAFSTSAVSLAAAKGKKPSKPAQKKKQATSFSKKGTAAVKAKGESSAGGARGDSQVDQVDLTEHITAEFEPTVALHGGVPTRFRKQNVDQLQAFGLPKRIAEEFKRGQAATVTRNSTVKLLDRLNTASSKSSKETRLVLSGSRGTGKSMVLLQAMTASWQKDWIVIYVPRATELINSTSPYAYNSTTQTFHQPALSSALLTSILAANKKILSTLSLEKEYTSPTGKAYPAGEKLDGLIARGAKETSSSVEVLEIVLDALSTQSQSPVLLAIDEAQALFMKSAYQSPDFEYLESYALSVPRLLVDFVSGRKSFNKGAVVTSVSYSTAHYAPPKELYAAVPELPSPMSVSPYDKIDEHHVASAKGLEVFEIGDKLDLQEARGILDLCQHRKFVFGVTDEMLLGKFAESGGNANEFVRGLTRTLMV